LLSAIDAKLDSTMQNVETRFSEHLHDFETRLSERLHHFETNLLAGFHNRSSPNEARRRTHSAVLRAIDAESNT
jgi:hypothetical protein